MQPSADTSEDLRLRFEKVDLAALDQVRLLTRVEQKYMLPATMLPVVLETLLPDFYMLEIDGISSFAYHTAYFDTPGFRLYLDHHNGLGNRIKVRNRLYEDTGQSFFEIKQKRQNQSMEKTRFVLPEMTSKLTADQQQLATAKRALPEPLEYKLTNRFRRITLCGKRFNERLTIDTEITMEASGAATALTGAMIIERKQERYTDRNYIPLLNPYLSDDGCSKYVLGAARLFAQLKHNNFKPHLLNLLKYER
jgi:hypothetical protein